MSAEKVFGNLPKIPSQEVFGWSRVGYLPSQDVLQLDFSETTLFKLQTSFHQKFQVPKIQVPFTVFSEIFGGGGSRIHKP